MGRGLIEKGRPRAQVGWVERSDTHHMVGITTFHPPGKTSGLQQVVENHRVCLPSTNK